MTGKLWLACALGRVCSSFRPTTSSPARWFEVDGERFEVGSELVPVGTGVYLTQVLTPDGQQLGVQLHVGRRIE